MRNSAILFGLLALPPLAVWAGCGSERRGIDGPSVGISVAPLTLAGVTDACYGLTVFNAPLAGLATADTVWTQAGICADQYGDGTGSITYIGTCDAASTLNTVELTLERLCSGGPCDAAATTDIATSEYDNPCPAATPCRLEAPCQENEDTLVEFTLTIMRDAEQGFFDIAVNFEDVFCSAKVDCKYDDGTAIELLHDGDARAQTLVMTLACTAGPGQSTILGMSDVVIACDSGQVYEISPVAGVGNIGPLEPFIFEHAIYHGHEELPGIDKCYWNLAIGLDTALTDHQGCRLSARATASPEMLEGGMTPLNTTWPIIDYAVEITGANGGLVCDQNPLNGEDSGVTTRYTALAGESICHWLACGDEPTVGTHASCGGVEPPDRPCITEADGDGVTRVLWYHAAYDNPAEHGYDIGSENEDNFLDMIADLEAGTGWQIDVWYLGTAVNDGSGAVASFNGPPAPLSSYDALLIDSEEMAIMSWPYYGVAFTADDEPYTPIALARSAIEAVRGTRTVVSGSDVDFHAIEWRYEPELDVDYVSHKEGARAADGHAGLLYNMLQWVIDGDGLGVVAPTTIGWGDASSPVGLVSNPDSFLGAELTGFWTNDYNAYDQLTISDPTHPINAGLSVTGGPDYDPTGPYLDGWPNHGVIAFEIPGYTGIQTTTGGDGDDPVGYVTVVKDRCDRP